MVQSWGVYLILRTAKDQIFFFFTISLQLTEGVLSFSHDSNRHIY